MSEKGDGNKDVCLVLRKLFGHKSSLMWKRLRLFVLLKHNYKNTCEMFTWLSITCFGHCIHSLPFSFAPVLRVSMGKKIIIKKGWFFSYKAESRVWTL